MIVIAHRGASGYAPEHTFASWDVAYSMGADYLEQDLQMTSDGVLVVMHDETVDRTLRRSGARVTGRVIDFTLAELQACDAGTWFGPEFETERVRTLEEVLKRYPDANFYIETKNPEEAPGMEGKLLALLAGHGLTESARTGWRVLIQSFSERSLRLMHEMDPALPLIRLLDRGVERASLDDQFHTIAQYAVGIGPHYSDVDGAFMRTAWDNCLEVHPYTVDDPAEMDRLTRLGVGGMFTNLPDRLLATRPSSEPRGLALLRDAARVNRLCRGKGDQES